LRIIAGVESLLERAHRIDVVVVGGGVIGLSTAFHLAEAGADVVLAERGELGSGSSSKAAGGIRAQFSDALNIAISQRSIQAYRDFARRPGWEIDFDPIGYLFVLDDEQQISAFERSIALQNAHGVPSRLTSPDEALELCPCSTSTTWWLRRTAPRMLTPPPSRWSRGTRRARVHSVRTCRRAARLSRSP
jgi:glycine/D-amino acid oxidase-like deaminating enzyme